MVIITYRTTTLNPLFWAIPHHSTWGIGYTGGRWCPECFSYYSNIFSYYSNIFSYYFDIFSYYFDIFSYYFDIFSVKNPMLYSHYNSFLLCIFHCLHLTWSGSSKWFNVRLALSNDPEACNISVTSFTPSPLVSLLLPPLTFITLCFIRHHSVFILFLFSLRSELIFFPLSYAMNFPR